MIERIKSFKQNKELYTLVSNFSYLSILQIASYAFPFITMPYLAKVIGAEGFGKIAFASALMLWFITIADWGFNYTATRDVAKIEIIKKEYLRFFPMFLGKNLFNVDFFSPFVY